MLVLYSKSHKFNMRGKICFLIILAVILVNLGFGMACAQALTAVYFEPENIEAEQGNNFFIILSINTDEVLSDMGFVLSYDSSLISYINTEEYYSQGCLFQFSNEIEPGTLSVNLSMCANIHDGLGKILKFNFQALDQNGTTDLIFSDTFLSIPIDPTIFPPVFPPPIITDWQAASVTILPAAVSDNEAPVINILEPTDEEAYSYVNADSSIKISGVATDNIGIASFGHIINNTGGAGILSSASSSMAWNFDILLLEGENTITILAADAVGNIASSTIIINYQLPDTEAPIIFNIATSTLADRATINWETSEPAFSIVEYGEDENYGHEADLISDLISEHSILIKNLNPNTLYHYRIKSKDIENNEAVSEDLIFITFPRPVLSLNPNNLIIGADQNFSLTLNIDTAIGISGVGGIISYNSNLISYGSVNENDFLSRKCSTTIALFPIDDGKLLFSLQCLNNANGIFGTGEVLKFNFQTKKFNQTATSTIYFSDYPDSEIVVPDGTPFTSISADWGEASITIDAEPPVITLNGPEIINLTVGDNYSDIGATALDDIVGDITSNIIVNNPVNTSKAGVYTITYNIADSAGNQAEPINRTVIVSVPPSGGIPVWLLRQNNQNQNQRQEQEQKKAEQDEIIVLGIEHEHFTSLFDLNGLSKETIESVSQSEAQAIYKHNQVVEMDELGKQIYKDMVGEYADGLTDQEKFSLAYFIQYGTFTTQKLGVFGRAGIISSYKQAFNKLPSTEAEWQDIIKVANGRWPSERNKAAEKAVFDNFKKIYLRESDRNNLNDDAAIMIMAYGINPAPRNLNSEKMAIGIFRSIYGYVPANADDWIIIKAIAYSGVKRK